MAAMSIEAIRAELHPHRRCVPMSPPWPDAVAMYGPRDEWGEARNDDELERMPVDVWVRVLVLEDGGTALRWVVDGSPEADDVLSGYLHDHIERGDNKGDGRSGWMKRRADGTVEVN
jgi:hypothetical protein